MKKSNVLQFPSPRREPDPPAYLRRNQIVEQHLHLVEPIARSIARFIPPSFELDDLVSEGNLGLIQAADRYLDFRGEFAPFAKMRIRGAILDSLRRRNWHFAKSAEELDTVSDLSDGANPGEAETKFSQRQIADRCLSVLEPREKAVVVEIYSKGQTHKQVGKKMSICASSVTRIHRRSVETMKDHVRRSGIAA